MICRCEDVQVLVLRKFGLQPARGFSQCAKLFTIPDWDHGWGTSAWLSILYLIFAAYPFPNGRVYPGAIRSAGPQWSSWEYWFLYCSYGVLYRIGDLYLQIKCHDTW